MSLRDYFQASKEIGRALTRRKARWVYATIASLLFVATTVVRVHTFILTNKIHAVIAGLSRLHIDETTEEEVLRTVPYLDHGEWHRLVNTNAEFGNIDKGIERHYFVTISNEPSWMRFESFAWRFSNAESSRDGRQKSWIFTVADLLGYRYIAFDAVVVLLDGKVSSVRYGIANNLVFPQPSGNIVSIRSVHTRWAPYRMGFEVSSIDDESPQFNVGGDDGQLTVLFAPDASPVLKSHLFQINLRCFWGLFGCRQARQVAPLLWQDKNAIEAATLARLQSNDPCPDRILVGRAKYLPDISVVLLGSTGFKVESINEEGRRVDETWTHYKQIEVLRGRASMSWESVRSRATVPYPGDYLKTLTNMGLQWAQAGEKVLAFSNLTFDSCQVVPASPSALSAIRNAIPAPRRVEDELVCCLQ
jgi:hypothetical protein